MLLIVGTQITPRAAASSFSWSGCFWVRETAVAAGGCRVKEGLFLDPGDSCRCVGEGSTWSTRSAASMNDVDADEHRQTIGRAGTTRAGVWGLFLIIVSVLTNRLAWAG